MATVIFYEKTGCSGNARQKALLLDAGHEVQARDLRHQPWNNGRLLSFLSGLPVAQWFNRSAPIIKSGALNPDDLDEVTALALLRDNPLLIRRPLLQVGDEKRVGFDAERVHAWIGLGPVPEGDLEACRHVAPPPRITYVQTGGGAMPCRFADDAHGHGGGCQP